MSGSLLTTIRDLHRRRGRERRGLALAEGVRRVEEALAGRPASPEVVEQAASLAAERASPLPMTRYKADLLPRTVRETLDRALA